MWRAMFLAIGFFVMLLGVECLGVERVTLKIRDEPPAPVSPFDTEPKTGAARADRPPPLGPLESALLRRVMCLYSFTIPRRVAGS